MFQLLTCVNPDVAFKTRSGRSVALGSTQAETPRSTQPQTECRSSPGVCTQADDSGVGLDLQVAGTYSAACDAELMHLGSPGVRSTLKLMLHWSTCNDTMLREKSF